MKKMLKKIVSAAVAVGMTVLLLTETIITSYAAVPDQYRTDFTECGKTLIRMNLLSGTGDSEDNLKIDSAVTRQEAVTMILSFMNEAADAKKMTSKEINAALRIYSDSNNVAQWARPMVAYATAKGYIGGRSDGSFDPLGEVKGYEFGIMLHNAMKYAPGTDYSTKNALKELTKKMGFTMSAADSVYIASLDDTELSRGACMAAMYGALGISRKDTGLAHIESLVAGKKLAAATANKLFYKVDVDLTKLSMTMIYSEIYNMLENPEKYIGKRIKIAGQFSSDNDPGNGQIYFFCSIADKAACCSQSLEFMLGGKHRYPDDYPELGSDITVIGEFSTYIEDGYEYYRLADATIFG